MELNQLQQVEMDLEDLMFRALDLVVLDQAFPSLVNAIFCIHRFWIWRFRFEYQQHYQQFWRRSLRKHLKWVWRYVRHRSLDGDSWSQYGFLVVEVLEADTNWKHAILFSISLATRQSSLKPGFPSFNNSHSLTILQADIGIRIQKAN